MTSLTRTAMIFFLLSPVFGAYQSTRRSPQSQDSANPQISVRISAQKTLVHPGENVILHVEIWNEASTDLFIFKDFSDPDNPLNHLDVQLYYGDRSETPAYEFRLADVPPFLVPHGLPLASALSIGCVALAPGHFYGGEMVMTAALFEHLRVAGKYRIQGTYWSRGFLAEDMNNPLLDYADELKKLPYKSWVGHVETNSVSIEVANPKKESP